MMITRVKKLLRWDYIAVRLILLFVLLYVSEVGLAIALKWGAVTAGQAATGARVDVDKVKASLLGARVAIGHVQIADPRSPMKNLVEADSIELDFDGRALLHGSATADLGVIRGLRFGTDRVTSGELEKSDGADDQSGPAAPSWMADAASQRAAAWMDDLEGRFAEDVTAQFESVRLAEELAAKWPAEYASLAAEARQIQGEVKLLEQQAKDARQNPLRNVEFIRDLPSRITGYQQKLKSLRGRMTALPESVRADRQRVAQARQHDEALLREKLKVNNANAQQLTDYLLGEQIGQPLAQMVGWLKWARALAPSKPEQATTTAKRGQDVRFAGCQVLPNLLVRRLELEGVVRVAGRSADLRGVVTDFTTQPRVLGQPMRIAIDTTGALPIVLRGTIDRTGDSPLDELVAECATVALPKADLGAGRRLRLDVAPSTAAVSVSVRLEGDALDGDIQINQQQVRISSRVDGDFGPVSGRVLTGAVDQSLGRLDKLVTRVTLTGTLDEPKWEVWSTLGPAVAEAVDRAVAGVVQQQTDRLAGEAQKQVDAQLQKLDSQLAAARDKATAAIDEPVKKLEQLVAETTQKALGNALPVQQLGEKFFPLKR
ncbi:hypothetical protein Pla175_39450 [Pirellulimonas nuda]|uniref:TIGR03545 family protein n=1 Tax=Pirellulimonas nuda TaxID=2528009 RepID=A0A518DGE8_9BACT|nr:TIGR03545 family protein [Pirellulimonas nuda]QDU90539.1 hypothetical protein Pla175_39450 [Pirellulimonas nuda]